VTSCLGLLPPLQSLRENGEMFIYGASSADCTLLISLPEEVLSTAVSVTVGGHA
jgi:hypothetical protein